MEQNYDVIILHYYQATTILYTIKSIVYSGIKIQNIFIIDNDSNYDLLLCLLKNYNKVIIINNKIKSNKSQSRNLGISMSTSDNILFIDGDDYFLPTNLRYVLNNDTSFLQYKRMQFGDYGNKIKNRFTYSCCVNVYKRLYIISRNLWFEKVKYKFFLEDVVFSSLYYDCIYNEKCNINVVNRIVYLHNFIDKDFNCEYEYISYLYDCLIKNVKSIEMKRELYAKYILDTNDFINKKLQNNDRTNRNTNNK